VIIFSFPFISCKNFDIRYEITLHADIERYLLHQTVSQDAFIKELLSKTSKQSRGKDEDFFGIFIKEINNNNISLNKYFGAAGEGNEKIISDLKVKLENMLNSNKEILKRRLEIYGLKQFTIERDETYKINVNVPSTKEDEKLRQMLETSGVLEIKPVLEFRPTLEIMYRIDSLMAVNGNIPHKNAEPELVNTDEIKYSKEHPLFYVLPFSGQMEEEINWFSKKEDSLTVAQIFNNDEINKLIPADIQFIWSKNIFNTEKQPVYALFAVGKTPLLTNTCLKGVNAEIDKKLYPPGEIPLPRLIIEMTQECASGWEEVTAHSINRRIAVIIDDKVYVAPVIRTALAGRQFEIAGFQNYNEAKMLEIILQSGALSVPVYIAEDKVKMF
jgi:preprotein translocase subunit SecD